NAVSPRTTAASVAFSNASTSAIAADSALPGAGAPGGTRLGGELVFGLHVASPADCAERPATTTKTRTQDVRSARIIQPPGYERTIVSPAIRYASKINATARAQSRAVAGGGSPRPIRSRHSLTTFGQPLRYPSGARRISSRPGPTICTPSPPVVVARRNTFSAESFRSWSPPLPGNV